MNENPLMKLSRDEVMILERDVQSLTFCTEISLCTSVENELLLSDNFMHKFGLDVGYFES